MEVALFLLKWQEHMNFYFLTFFSFGSFPACSRVRRNVDLDWHSYFCYRNWNNGHLKMLELYNFKMKWFVLIMRWSRKRKAKWFVHLIHLCNVSVHGSTICDSHCMSPYRLKMSKAMFQWSYWTKFISCALL